MPFHCEVCNRFFNFEGSLLAHYNIHCGEKTLNCDMCRKVFRYKHSLQSHTPLKTEANLCDSCRKFSLKNDDKKIVLENKPFICEVCGKGCNTKCNLIVHYNVHRAVKPFKCEICHKRFVQKCTLRTHRRTHTGEKPFKCSICSRSFGYKFGLDSHNRHNHAGCYKKKSEKIISK